MSAGKREPGLICWVVTDGRAGIEAQALGLAEAVAERLPFSIVRKRLVVGEPWRRLPRVLWGDPATKLSSASDDLDWPSPGLAPALWIGCGRLSVPFSMAAKKRGGPLVAQLQNPRAPTDAFDLVIAPRHDGLVGENVFPIIGSTMRARNEATARRDRTPRSLAVFIGGPNRAFDFSAAGAAVLGEKLRAVAATGVRVMVTTSRRTPEAAAAAFEKALAGSAATFWRNDRDPPKDNPYAQMLAEAEAFLVTEDSVNMAVEAGATGAPVYICKLARRPFSSVKKFDAFHQSLAERRVTRDFSGAVDDRWTYQPLRETARAADEIVRRLKERGI